MLPKPEDWPVGSRVRSDWLLRCHECLPNLSFARGGNDCRLQRGFEPDLNRNWREVREMREALQKVRMQPAGLPQMLLR